MINLIVAMANNNVIGSKNDLPWYLPADLKHFKELTSGHAVIMGRNTLESILNRLGKPLPNRQNIVVSRNESYQVEGIEVVGSIEAALEAASDEEVFIIGGAQVYQQALPLVERIYVTQVNAKIDGDAFFPNLNPEQWREVANEPHQADDKNQFDYSFKTLDRVN